MPGHRTNNHLLQSLAKSDPAAYSQLFEELDPVALDRGAIVSAVREPSEWVYFVDSGVVSLVCSTRSGNYLEVAIIGREGVTGLPDALGGRPLPYRVVVQLPGVAYRAPRPVISHHIFTCGALHQLLMEYAQFLTHQLAQSAVCNRFHTSLQRLARWLLLIAQRGETERFELTHDFAAQMIGAPRSAVTQALSSLRDRRIIDYRRGVLTIRSRRGLRAAACECFDALRT